MKVEVLTSLECRMPKELAKYYLGCFQRRLACGSAEREDPPCVWAAPASHLRLDEQGSRRRETLSVSSS